MGVEWGLSQEKKEVLPIQVCPCPGAQAVLCMSCLFVFISHQEQKLSLPTLDLGEERKAEEPAPHAVVELP